MATILRHIGLLAFLLIITMSVSAQDSLKKQEAKTASNAPVSDSIQPIHGLELPDSLSISILTCTPGPDLYSKFGHTAVRVKDCVNDRDVVFNYGCFDGSANDFVFKFLLGQTDYLLGAEHFDDLVARYGYMGVGVKEQVLNLSQTEAREVLNRLLVNILPENQQYRYEWLGVNCTNMVQFMIESLVEDEGGRVVYDWGDEHAKKMTVRDMLHEQLKLCPWVSFGIDMVLGYEIDDFTLTDVNPYSMQLRKLFLPAYFMEVVDRSKIEDAQGAQRNYVVEEHELIPPVYVESTPSHFTPKVVFLLLLAVVMGVSVYDMKRKKASLWMDVTLNIAQGLAGLLVAFLFFFSEHPGVDTNLLVVIFNPLPLFYAGWMLSRKKKRKKSHWGAVNALVLTTFLVAMPFCPQSFSPAMYILISALLVRAIAYWAIDARAYRPKV